MVDFTMLTVAAVIIACAYAVNVIVRCFSRLHDAIMKKRFMDEFRPFLDMYSTWLKDNLLDE